MAHPLVIVVVDKVEKRAVVRDVALQSSSNITKEYEKVKRSSKRSYEKTRPENMNNF